MNSINIDDLLPDSSTQLALLQRALSRIDELEIDINEIKSTLRLYASNQMNHTNYYCREILQSRLPTFYQAQYYYLLSLKECQALREPGLCNFAQVWAEEKYKIAFPNSNPQRIEGLLIHDLGNAILLTDDSIPPEVSWSFSAGVVQQHALSGDTCIWESKPTSFNETRLITGHLHHVIAINTTEGRIIIDWGIGQFKDTKHLFLLIGGMKCMI